MGEKTSTNNLIDNGTGSRHILDKYHSVQFSLNNMGPVYLFKLRNISINEPCILVKEDSLLMNHLKSGQTIMVKYYFEDRHNSSDIFEAKIMHITLVKVGQFKGHYLAGLANLK